MSKEIIYQLEDIISEARVKDEMHSRWVDSEDIAKEILAKFNVTEKFQSADLYIGDIFRRVGGGDTIVWVNSENWEAAGYHFEGAHPRAAVFNLNEWENDKWERVYSVMGDASPLIITLDADGNQVQGKRRF